MIYRISASILALFPVSVSRSIVRRIGRCARNGGTQQKQLLIDISEVIKSDARTGIQRVVRGILPFLMEKPPIGFDVRPVFADKNHGYHYAPVTAGCLQADDQKRQNAGPVIVNAGDIFLGLDLAAHLLPRHQGQLLRWKRHGTKLGFMVYDLLPLLHPHWFNPKRYRTFNRWLRTLAIYGDDLICISETVKSDLHQWLATYYDLSENDVRLHTFPLGADIASTIPSTGRSADEQALIDQFHGKPFVLMVGTLEPRKGYDQALNAFEQLWQNNDEIILVIVGKPGWKTEAVQGRLRTHKERNSRLFWFDNASDELLQALYQEAKGVLLASEAEGYGLPLIEAAQYGKPVLARDIAVFREIASPDTSFFDRDSFAESLGTWVLRIQSRNAGHSPPAHASWTDSTACLAGIVTNSMSD